MNFSLLLAAIVYLYCLLVLASQVANSLFAFRYLFAPIVYFICVLISASPNATSLFSLTQRYNLIRSSHF